MSGRFIDIAAGRAYVAVPEAERGPGLLLLPDGSDEERELRELGDLYAAEGYVVLCPEVSALSKGVQDIAAAVAALRACSECTGKVGALGFGLGGKLAYLAAVEADIDCAVSYYGFGIDFGLNLVSRIGCPLVLHFAEKDPQIPPEAVARVQAAFSGRPGIAIYVYPGAAPGFDRPNKANYRQASCRARAFALDRVIAPGDGAALRPRGAVGDAHDLRICHPRRRRNDAHDDRRALRQSHPGHDRRRRSARSCPLLCASFHSETSGRHPAGADLADGRRRPYRRRDAVLLHARHRNRFSPAGHPADRQICRGADGGDRQFPRRQDLSRAHLLGPGERAGPDRAARPQGLAGRRHRYREKATRRDAPFQHADGAMGGERARR